MEGSGPSQFQLAHSISKLNFSCSVVVYLWLRAVHTNFSTPFSGPTFLVLDYCPRDTEVSVLGLCQGGWVAWGEPAVSR